MLERLLHDGTYFISVCICAWLACGYGRNEYNADNIEVIFSYCQVFIKISTKTSKFVWKFLSSVNHFFFRGRLNFFFTVFVGLSLLLLPNEGTEHGRMHETGKFIYFKSVKYAFALLNQSV